MRCSGVAIYWHDNTVIETDADKLRDAFKAGANWMANQDNKNK